MRVYCWRSDAISTSTCYTDSTTRSGWRTNIIELIMSYDNTNTGMLSRNDRKTQETHPDYSGFINVDGVEFWLSGWLKEGKAGGKMEGKKAKAGMGRKPRMSGGKVMSSAAAGTPRGKSSHY